MAASMQRQMARTATNEQWHVETESSGWLTCSVHAPYYVATLLLHVKQRWSTSDRITSQVESPEYYDLIHYHRSLLHYNNSTHTPAHSPSPPLVHSTRLSTVAYQQLTR